MKTNILSWTGIQDVSWIPVLKNNIKLGSLYKVVPTEGYIAWEYNPLRNYRLNENMYEKDGKYYTEKEFFELNPNLNESSKELPDNWTLREAGELVDFITDELSFNLSNPVDILPQYSYDGSVNLILNDGLNIPRLINSRFTVTGKNTYKIIDRKGDNDTNIYDQGEQFDVDTSLFKNVNKIPKLEYLGTSQGNMKIGNYHFYFKYSDSDGNESDWVAESGLVSVFIGGSPTSVNTGIRDENSIKSVKFRLSNIDIGYSYVKVYYTRYSADVDSNLIVSAKKIDKNFLINNAGTCNILITGDENETEVTLEEINSSFDVIQNAQTQCTAGNRLFMANIHKSKIEYDMLSKLSLCFCPYKHEEDYPLTKDNGINETYQITANSYGYYDSEYIYNKTGYWPNELYRIGVVYILKDGSLSPVFNIRGATNILNNSENIYKIEQDFLPDENGNIKSFNEILSEIEYSEENFMITGGTAENENAKGVIQLNGESNSNYPFPVYGINIKANSQVIKELKKYCKGFFFVRQKRMPLTMCQGLVIGLDKESRTPVLPTMGGVLTDIDYSQTYIESKNINDINYVSEGFLSHYKYKYEREKDGTGKKMLKGLAVVAILAATVALTIVTMGAGGVVAGVVGAAVISSAAMTAALLTTATIAVAAAVVTTASIGANAIVQRIRSNKAATEIQEIKGRIDEIPKGVERVEQEESRQLTEDITKRYLIKDPDHVVSEAIIVPDYQVNQPYYNQFLTGSDFVVRLIREQPITNYQIDGYFTSKNRHFYTSYIPQDEIIYNNVKLVGVPDGCPIKMINDNKYRARAGYAEEAYKYEFFGKSYDDSLNKKDNSDIVRGNFGSYVGITNYSGHACDQIEIMIPGYKENNLFNYIQLRAQDTSAFYAISDRIDINNLNKSDSYLEENNLEEIDFNQTYFRGDCYICQYTHRIIRNFNDPSAPYNDKIIDINTWKDNYDPDNTENYANINLGDVNAVPIGLWLTFQLRSSYNLNIRTIDKSHVDESIMCGNYRSFYPHYGQTADGGLKIPDSDQYNKGFSKSVSEKYYFEVPDVPYIKQEFQNRIVFSDIHINDAYKNGFRILRNVNHKDYPMTYGSITKLIEYKNSLIIIFEHGIGMVSINNSSEHPSQILSDLNIISDTYGSQWKDSIIKTPSGIYGVDTVAKKIWRVRNGDIELISDMKIQEFLNQNITFSERELTPILGIRNVKTFYNAFKHDVMFTFYDNLYGTYEKSWNLCYNEILQIFTTFYSWIPSDMINIDNIPFSFNRDTVKSIVKLGISDHKNDFSDGVTLTNNIIDIKYSEKLKYKDKEVYLKPTFSVKNKNLIVTYLDKHKQIKEYEFPDEEYYNQKDNQGNNIYVQPENTKLLNEIINNPNFIGFLYLDNRVLLNDKTKYYITYELQRDNKGNYKMFDIISEKVAIKQVDELFADDVNYINVSYLVLKSNINISNLLSELYYRNSEGHSYADDSNFKIIPKSTIMVSSDRIPGTQIKNKYVLNQLITKYGEDWPIGWANNQNDDLNFTGFLKDIDQSKLKNVKENEEDSTNHENEALNKYYLLNGYRTNEIYLNKPIFKNKQGKRLMLNKQNQINPDKIVRYLNIKANVFIENSLDDTQNAYYNQFANGSEEISMIDAGYFESNVAITTNHNLSLLSTDFWKHGQAGIIDITDKIYPTYWYGQQHPFEFECVVVDNPSVHKIFTNLELIANKVKPESFHYEVVGDVYDFAEDKPTMYFRQEALKALYQYNGYDIEYNPNFLEIEPKQHNRSADLPKYYSRWNTINDIYDSYKRFSAPIGFNYDHLSGAEIVYYPTRNEFRIWNHVEAIDVDSKILNKQGMEIETSIIKANCRYLEDKWLVSINPIIVTYKNEFNKQLAISNGKSIFTKNIFTGKYNYSSWVGSKQQPNDPILPPINIQGTKLHEVLNNKIEFPGEVTEEMWNSLTEEQKQQYTLSSIGKDNALYNLYDLTKWRQGDWRPIDPVKNKDRKETDVRGKFIKIRIRYSGEELAIIDFLNTIYQISFA